MVKLNKIYTRTGDDGSTGLANGERRAKCDSRVEAYGDVDETNSAIGLARLSTAAMPELDAMLERIQNDLFDLGADLATPPSDKPLGYEPLRIVADPGRPAGAGNRRAERPPEPASFFRPARRLRRGGRAASRPRHFPPRRTANGRACAATGESVGEPALHFINRLSDFLFVAARIANQ